MGFGGIMFVVDCVCFEGIVVADEAACAAFGGATFVVGTCLGI